MKTRIAAMLAVLALAGCAGPTTPPRTTIDINDSGVFVPAASVSIGIPGSRDAPSHPQNGHAIELGFSTASGGNTQTLASGQQPVVFGNTTFIAAGQQLQNDFDFTFLEAAYRFRWFFGEVFGIEARGGLAHANLDLTVSSPAQRASENVDSAGAVAGFGLLWRLRPGSTVQARATFFASGDDDGVSDAQRFELSFMQGIGRNIGLRAGYVWWQARSDRDEFVKSPIELKFSGPVLGLDVAF